MRPAFADDQLRRDGGSRVGFELKTPWRDGTTHLEMTPVDFLERLAALVPRPRLHLIRFHGILARNAKLRSVVVRPARIATAERADNDARSDPDFTLPTSRKPTRQGDKAASRGETTA